MCTMTLPISTVFLIVIILALYVCRNQFQFRQGSTIFTEFLSLSSEPHGVTWLSAVSSHLFPLPSLHYLRNKRSTFYMRIK